MAPSPNPSPPPSQAPPTPAPTPGAGRSGPAPKTPAELSTELQAAALRELLRSWHALNYTHFHDALVAPTLELSDVQGRLGQWDAPRRRIEIARHLLLEQPWGVVLEVLKHEMAHQFVNEVLKVNDEAAHGKAFRDLCARVGVDAAASGLPGAPEGRSDDEDRIIQRVARLLALAESPNEHEAQAAMNAAQKLMLKYNLSVGQGRSDQRFRHLASILGEHFFVETIWVPVYRAVEGKRGSILEICGSEANLELASYVHAFLLDTSGRLWTKHRAEAKIRGNRDRQKFVAGVMLGFREKLRAQARESQSEGLVWVKDGNLDAYFRKRHPRIRHVSYRGGRPSEAYAHGREAGRNIILHRPVAEGPSGGVRLLGAGKR
jgi:hypothetical protein